MFNARRWVNERRIIKHGKLRVVGSLGYTGPREELEQYIGQCCEVKSFGPQYETGALRHPGFVRWRNDEKRAIDCVFDFKDGGKK